MGERRRIGGARGHQSQRVGVAIESQDRPHVRRRAWKRKCIQLMKFVHYAKYVKLAFPIVTVAPPPLTCIARKIHGAPSWPKKEVKRNVGKMWLGWLG